MTNLDLADSALHAPSAGFGDVDFYPDFVDKVAVIVVRLAKNHPLPDGNKRSDERHRCITICDTTGGCPERFL